MYLLEYDYFEHAWVRVQDLVLSKQMYLLEYDYFEHAWVRVQDLVLSKQMYSSTISLNMPE